MDIGTIIVVIMVGVYVYLLVNELIITPMKMKRERKNAKEKFFQIILKGLKTGSINNIDKVDNIYGGIISSSENLDYDEYIISDWLREFSNRLISKEIDKSTDDKTIVDWLEKIALFINKLEEISEYSELPGEERIILTDISTYPEICNKEEVKRKLFELAVMTKTKNKEFDQSRNSNKWALYVPAAGFIPIIILAFRWVSLSRKEIINLKKI